MLACQGADLFRGQGRIAQRDGVARGVLLNEGGRPESRAVHQLGRQVVACFPDQRQARIGGAAKIGIIVVAQAAGQRPVAGQAPFVLQIEVVDTAFVGGEENIGAAH